MSSAPGHTDLMVTPESLDAWLEKNPPPIFATEDDFNDDGQPVCTNRGGRQFVCEDAESGEGRSYCQWCLADGDA